MSPSKSPRRSLDEKGLNRGERVSRDLVVARQAFLADADRLKDAEEAYHSFSRVVAKRRGEYERALKAFDEYFGG